uniref:WXG100 family type VII secretion target n=1 Tax=Paractinoplanes polyasparticus TaxID=2856853 RepID=UPI001C841EB1|nr:WXG100 family type VII secretion target [Actinoplanes polyasparticus]
MSDSFNYQYGPLSDFTEYLDTKKREVQTLIDGMMKTTNSSLEGWEGNAADRYKTNSNDIQTDLTDLNEIVQRLAIEVREGAERMQDQDRRSGDNFATR